MGLFDWFISIMSFDRAIAALIGFALGLLTYVLNVRKFHLDLEKEKREVDKYRRELQNERDSIFSQIAAIFQESMDIYSEVERNYLEAINVIKTREWLNEGPVTELCKSFEHGLSVVSTGRAACYLANRFLLKHGSECAFKETLQTAMEIRLQSQLAKQEAVLIKVTLDGVIKLDEKSQESSAQIIMKLGAVIGGIDQTASGLRKAMLMTQNAFSCKPAERKLMELRQRIVAYPAARIETGDVEELGRLFQEVSAVTNDMHQEAQQFMEHSRSSS
ncbi:MAG: hypothetical protein U1C96_01320 [Gallionella sp.]|nr:hypothetical protein [Gallionella sp.]